MELPALELHAALQAAATRVAETLRCEKVDAFLLDEESQTLRAAGTSETPMGRRQHELGLDSLPLANGGRAVEVFKSGTSYLEAHADRDPNEVRGIVEELGVRSTITVPFDIDGLRRGALAAASSTPEFFQVSDLRFLEIVARWVGILAQRAEVAETTYKLYAEHARREGADELITVLAHDLRNHLHPLLVRLQLMRVTVESGKNVSASDIERAVQSVQRLARLTEDLLDLKRLDEGLFSLNLVAVDLASVAKEAASSLATNAVAVRVTGASTLIAIGDRDRLQQALENIVANAIKYSPAGKSVEIRLSSDERDGKPWCILEVLDQGPGIAPEMVSTLFERFRFGAESKGIGLGLHLAHRIARIHHGELSAHPRPGGGTRFRLTLPLDPSERECRE